MHLERSEVSAGLGENALFQRWQDGDGTSFEELFRRSGAEGIRLIEGALMRAGIPSAADDAEDIWQEFGMHVMRNPPDRRFGSFRSWFTAALSSVCRRWIEVRRHQVRPMHLDVHGPVARMLSDGGMGMPTADISYADVRDSVQRAIYSVCNPQQRQVAEMKFLQEMTVPEIARQLHRSRVTTQKHYLEARTQLQRWLWYIA